MSAGIFLCVVIEIEAHLVLLLLCDHRCWQEPITDLVTSRLEREHAAMADRWLACTVADVAQMNLPRRRHPQAHGACAKPHI
jgi:hypothetical protein